MYISQLAFTTGEISPDVSRRFDLDQFKSALLLAENAVIRPYGAVARRQGSEYIGKLKTRISLHGYLNLRPRRINRFYSKSESSISECGGMVFIQVLNYRHHLKAM